MEQYQFSSNCGFSLEVIYCKTAWMNKFMSGEMEVTPVQRLGLRPALLTQNILYCSEGMQATAIVLINSYEHMQECMSLFVRIYFRVDSYFLN